MPSPRANSVAPAAAPRLRRSSSGASGLSRSTQRTCCQPCGAKRDAAPVAAVGQPVDRQRLQPAALGQPALHVGNEAVEQPVLAVLGLVDDAGRRIDAGGLVVEPAHRLERHRIDRPGRRGRHLEHVAVLLVDLAVGLEHALLAGQPRAPRRDPAGAVADRARERAELLLDRERARVEHQRGRAARAAAPGCARGCRRPCRSRRRCPARASARGCAPAPTCRRRGRSSPSRRPGRAPCRRRSSRRRGSRACGRRTPRAGRSARSDRAPAARSPVRPVAEASPPRVQPLAASAAKALPVARRKRRRLASMDDPPMAGDSRPRIAMLEPNDRAVSALEAVARARALWSTAANGRESRCGERSRGRSWRRWRLAPSRRPARGAGPTGRARRADHRHPGRARRADARADDARREAHAAQGLLRHRLPALALRSARGGARAARPATSPASRASASRRSGRPTPASASPPRAARPRSARAPRCPRASPSRRPGTRSWPTPAGAMIGAEARADGFNVLLGGSVNLMREPRNGRNFEYAGEDPLLAGTMVGARSPACSRTTSSRPSSTSRSTTRRPTATTATRCVEEARAADVRPARVPDRDRARQSGLGRCAPTTASTGRYACEHPFLLTQVLRDEWGWPGYVMSDWGAVHSTAAAANAGLDQESGFGLQRADWFDARQAQGRAGRGRDHAGADRPDGAAACSTPCSSTA